MRICAYCLMPNHWHMVLWPENDGELAAFMQRLSVTHVARDNKGDILLKGILGFDAFGFAFVRFFELLDSRLLLHDIVAL